MSDKYLATIGLEIHAELRTETKMFCACANDPDAVQSNAHVCPICLGHPGTLPVLNKEAVKKVLQIGLAVDGVLADFTEWDRKNYFYPDIPKGYQISQYAFPLVSGGTLADVEIERIHLEEDTAQSTHDTHEKSLMNFNRSGVPLMELVTKPIIHDGETAVNFARELQLLLRYLGAGSANMEKGEMRIEANISVSKDSSLGTKTEVKNLNSFRSVEKAISYEIDRQTSLLQQGDKVIQETRGWDDNKGVTYSQRLKEGSHDYRYFPDPDIPKLKISTLPEFAPDNLKKEMPELPWIKRDRYKNSYGLTDKELAIFVETPAIASYFEDVIRSFPAEAKSIKLTVNYLLTDYLGLLKKENSGNIEAKLKIISASNFAELIGMVAKGAISSRGAKDLLVLLLEEGGASPNMLAEKHGLLQKSNASDLVPIIEQIISDNPKVVSEYKGGKTASFQFLIGQAMKLTKGSANPEILRKILLEKLS